MISRKGIVRLAAVTTVTLASLVPASSATAGDPSHCTEATPGTDGKVYDMETGREVPRCRKQLLVKLDPAPAAGSGGEATRPCSGGNWRERARCDDRRFSGRNGGETAPRADIKRPAAGTGGGVGWKRRAAEDDARFACQHGKTQYC